MKITIDRSNLWNVASFLDSVDAPVLLAKADGTVELVNSRASEFLDLNFGIKEIDHLSNLFPEDKVSEMLAHFFNDVSLGKRWRGELSVRDKTDTLRTVRLSLQRIEEENDRPPLLTITLDVPPDDRIEKRGTGESLKDSPVPDMLENRERNLKSLWDSSFDSISRLDSDLRYTYVNATAEQAIGLPVSEILGKSVHELGARLNWGDSWKEKILRVFETGETHDEILDLWVEDGNSFSTTHWKVFPEIGPEGNVESVISFARDISALRKVEEEKRTLKQQLTQAQKMETIGRLAGGVAHDFNNILTGITGNIALALMEVDPDDPLFELLQEVYDSSERAADLTRQLLTFSRKQIVSERVVNINHVIENLRRMLVRIIGEDIKLATDLKKPLGRIKADPSQLEQIILNIAVNARDAMPGGGQLTIHTSDIKFDEEFCRNHAGAKSGHYVMLSIRDTGCGMEEEIKGKIFEPFFTTKPNGRGTGLGLATTYSIVKQHRGYIEVFSLVDVGTTFKIYLPSVTDPAESVRDKQSNENLPTGDEMILLVEDEKIVREMTTRMLERFGYHVLVAKNGKDALGVAEENGYEMDLLLTDVVMPEMNGKDLADRLRSIKSDLKILFASGYTDDIISRHGILYKGTNFLPKPYSPSELANIIRNTLDGEEPV